MSRPPFNQHSTNGSKTSYQSVPTGPNMGYYNTGHSQPVDPLNPPSRKTAQVVRILLVTLCLALALSIPVAVWAWYVFIRERTVIDRANLLVFTTAGPTQFLLIATVSTTVTKVILGPLIGLYAFTASADWLNSSDLGLHQRLPSPVHLGTLLTIFQSVSLVSLLNATKGAVSRKQLAWPPVLKRAVALLVWLLFLGYALTSVSFWLQIDSKPTMAVPATNNFQSLGYYPQNTLFARTINQTECAWVKASRPNFGELSCGLTDNSKSTTRSYLAARTAQVLTNNSDISRAAWLNDGTAILAPSAAPSIGYRAKALGVRAFCKSVTDQCAKCNSTKSDTIIQCQGATAGLTLACSASAKVNATTESFGGYVPWGPISPENGTEIYRGFSANPFPYGGVISSFAYYNQSLVTGGLDYFVGNTGFLQHGVGGALNVLYCDISILDVTYQFTPPETYALISSSLTDATTAGYVAYGMTSWFTGSVRGFESIDGAGRSGSATYPELYARQLNKMVISTVTSIAPPTSADSLIAGRIPGSQVTLIGMLLLFVLLGCTMITVICIGLHAALVSVKSASRFMAAARGRLISVYPLIGDSFGGLNFDFQNHKTAASAGMDETAFLQETESDRLHLVQEHVYGGNTQDRTVRLRPRRV